MVYKPFAGSVALIAGLRRLCRSSVHASRRRSRGNVGIPQGFPRGVGRGGKTWLSTPSIPRHFHGFFGATIGLQLPFAKTVGRFLETDLSPTWNPQQLKICSG